MKIKGLGRGLDALLGGDEAAPAPPQGAMREVPVDQLKPGRYQPRSNMHHEALLEMAESIKAQGVMQPILARGLPKAATRSSPGSAAGVRRAWRGLEPCRSLAAGHSRPAGARGGADRKHPTRRSERARRGAGHSTARSGVRAHPPERSRNAGPLPCRSHELAAASRARAARARAARGRPDRHGPCAGFARAARCKAGRARA